MVENTLVFGSYFKKWKYASKIDSWPKMLAPAFLGQLLGYFVAQSGSFFGFVIGMSMTMTNLLLIVYLNDWGDQRVDSIRRQMFPSACSPKTIPDRILGAKALLAAGIFAAVCMLGISIIAAWFYTRPLLPIFVVLALLLMHSYTFYPFKFNYRGGGELVEMIGIGFVLPWLNSYAQNGIIWDQHYTLLLGSSTLALASALASGIADEDSDLAGGKQTFATRYGNNCVKQAVACCLFLSPFAWLSLALSIPGFPIYILIAPSFFIVYFGIKMQKEAKYSSSRAFKAQKQYKSYLHNAIWLSILSFALGLFFL
ncbi:MAG: prenyltransferase [Oligoflexales bacterium]